MTRCSSGRRHFSLAGTRSVAVAAQEARPYVLTKEKTPDFVGLSRGGFGNPFDVTTESGRPLAEDFAAAVSSSLSRRGFKATAVNVAASTALPDVRALASQAGAERVALVSIHEWKSDTITGRDNLGGSAMNPPGHAKGAVPEAYRRKLVELFSPDAVQKSLR